MASVSWRRNRAQSNGQVRNGGQCNTARNLYAQRVNDNQVLDKARQTHAEGDAMLCAHIHHNTTHTLGELAWWKGFLRVQLVHFQFAQVEMWIEETAWWTKSNEGSMNLIEVVVRMSLLERHKSISMRRHCLSVTQMTIILDRVFFQCACVWFFLSVVHCVMV